MTRILITGAAGAIGRKLRADLALDNEVLRLSDIADMPPATGTQEVVQADLSDMDRVMELVRDVDVIIHLAASLGAMRENGKVVGETPWEKILNNNICATYNIFEAARLSGVKRIVYASSIHAHGFYRKTTVVGDHLPPRPDSRYGLSKAFGESLGRYYADKFAMEVVALRIATYKDAPTVVRDLGTWLSPDDMVRLARASIDTLDVHFDVLYGMSGNKRGLYPDPNAKRFGYFPQDDSETYRERLLAQQTEVEPLLDRTFHAAHLAATEFAGDVSKIT